MNRTAEPEALIFRHACRLGSTLAALPYPLAARTMVWGSVGLVDIEALSRAAGFEGPVRAALAGLEAPSCDLSAGEIAALSSRAAGRFALMVATQPPRTVDALALDVSAAVWHRRILRLALRQDRARVRDALGAEAVHLATHEVPALHPSLAMLDAGDPHWDELMREEPEAGRRAAVAYGRDVILACVDGAHAALGVLVRRCLGISGDRFPALSPALEGHFLKLVSRRGEPWSAIIG